MQSQASFNMSHFPETEEEVDVEIGQEDKHAIILYNDEVNTFDHVINSLIKVCQHNELQAEQVAWIVHTKGKCDVKHGPFESLQPICKSLQNKGLSAVIEQ